MNGGKKFWNEANETFLRISWPLARASEIAAQLGCSRNAVIGKAHRLGLKGISVPEWRSQCREAATARNSGARA